MSELLIWVFLRETDLVEVTRRAGEISRVKSDGGSSVVGFVQLCIE